MGAEGVQPAESASVMTSSGQNQSEISSETAAANLRTVEKDWHCIYPHERREKIQIYTLLNISNSAAEQEEKSWECVNGTGWEEAVQGWNKTAPFAYLQLQKKARKTRSSESARGCLYCLDSIQAIDKVLDQTPKLNASVTTDSIPEKQSLLCSYTTPSSYAAVDDLKKDSYNGKLYSTQMSQGEKKRLSFKEVQASLSEKKYFLMKESHLFQAEKKIVPIREYSILPHGKPKSLETFKCKDIKSHEPSLDNLRDSEATTLKSSVVLPPLKDTTLKNSLDPSPKKSKPVIFQANENTSCTFSETVSCAQVFKNREPKHEKGIDVTGDAVKIHRRTSFAPKFPKTSCIPGTMDQCSWPCALLHNRKITTIPNSIALRRKSHLSSMHFLHTKGARDSKADENRDPCTRNKHHTGPKQENESKTQETPLLSGLFPSLTVHGWGRATPFACCKSQQKSKKAKISETVSNISHTSKAPDPKKHLACVTKPAVRDQTNTYCKFTKGETLSSCKKSQAAYIKPYNYIPVMTAHIEQERINGKLDSIQTFLSEKRALSIKEYKIKCSQGHKKPSILECHEIHGRASHSNPSSNLRYLTLNAWLTLNRAKRGLLTLHLEPFSEKNAASSHSRRIKKGKERGKKNMNMINNIATKQIKKTHVSPSRVSSML